MKPLSHFCLPQDLKKNSAIKTQETASLKNFLDNLNLDQTVQVKRSTMANIYIDWGWINHYFLSPIQYQTYWNQRQIDGSTQICDLQLDMRGVKLTSLRYN